MCSVEKLAVFDLDGTLYKGNSHIELLNFTYNNRYNKLIYKIFARLRPKLFQEHIDKMYSRVDSKVVKNFTLEVRESAIKLLNEKINDGYHAVIISNAPNGLVEAAGRHFNLDCYRSDIGEKHLILNNIQYCELFVCTDNITDLSILELADSSVVYCKKKNIRLFSKLKNVKFMEV